MKMSDKQVRQMLQKYMDGLTSVDEERRLAEYFQKAADKVAPEGISAADWQAYKEMFAMFAPKSHKAGGAWRWRGAAAAVVLLAATGGWLWFDRPAPPLVAEADRPVTVVKADTAATEAISDTTAIEAVPQPKTPDTKKPVRRRYEPPVPRHYLAQAEPPSEAPEEVDMEEAMRQADLLMQAVYLQQQTDLNSAMMQCTLVIEEEEEAF